jgi:WD40 repeat protein/tRNA A-37 threonylcarbamoyl transferase component Bud32
MNPPKSCPESAQLQELLAGNLPEPAQAELTSHLETCVRCQQHVEELSATLDLCPELARRLGRAQKAPEPALRQALDELKEDPGPDATRPELPSNEELPLDFLDPPTQPEQLGRLGPYEIREALGSGGMGIVLKAFDPKLHRVVAIKVLAPQLATSATARKRFVREAQAAAAVRDQHVVDIHAVDEANGLPYLVMEYISGISLQECLDRTGPLELKEILRIGIQTATGLAAAHAQGLIHRDIKPANILLENGVQRVKITDFGLARAADDASLTQSGVVAGTPQYMAPEQARGEAVDHRADLFSLGSVLYALCTGRLPFRASSTMAVLKRVCEQTPRPIREINPEIPGWLVEIISRLHAKDPADRFSSATVVAELLSQHLAQLQQHTVRLRPATSRAPTGIARGRLIPAGWHRPLARRRRWAVATAVLLLLAGGLGLTEATGVTRVTATVIRILTPEGTLLVEVDDPAVKVTIEGDGGIVITGAGPQEVRLRPGSYRFRATKDGTPIKDDIVTITRDHKEVVRVSVEGVAAKKSAPPGPLDRLDAAAIPATDRFPWQPPELVAILGQHRGRQWSEVRSVAYSPDGKWIASGSGGDGFVYVWHADTLQLHRMLVGHRNAVWSVVFSPDSQQLLTGGDDGTVRLWSVREGRELRQFTGHEGYVLSVALSPDGRRALSAGYDRLVRVWDVETAKELVHLSGHTAKVTSVAFTPDGQSALSGSADQTMRRWDLKTANEVQKFEGHTGEVRFVASLPDGHRALSCGPDRTVRLWDLSNGKEIRRYEGHAAEVRFCAVTPDGRRALSGGADGTLRLWDIGSGKQLCSLAVGISVESGAFSPDGTLGLSGSWDGNLRRWDLERGVEHEPSECAIAVKGAAYVSRVIFSPDGRRLLSCTGEEVARLWDLSTGKELRRFRLAPDIWAVAFSHDGRLVLCGGGSGVRIWMAETGEEVRHIATPGGVWGLALSNDDRWLVTGGQNDRAHMWDMASGRELSPLASHGRQVLDVAFSPDSRRLLSAGEDGTVHLWELDTGRERERLEGHTASVWGAAFSPTGRHAASSDDAGFVRLYDVSAAGVRVHPLPRWHDRAVRSLAFSPDGQTLASAGHDGRIILWDVVQQAKLRDWQLPGPVLAVGFAPDGRHLATVNRDGSIFILRIGNRQ